MGPSSDISEVSHLNGDPSAYLRRFQRYRIGVAVVEHDDTAQVIDCGTFLRHAEQ